MKNLSEELMELYEMSNLVQDDTGLDFIIWVSAKSGKEKHGPRIKVQTTKAKKIQAGNWVSVTISDEPVMINKNKQTEISNKDFNNIKNFISKNKSVLEDYWNSIISTSQMIKSIVPV